MGIGTEVIHAGQEPDPTTGAVTPPIYQTSTYVQEELGRHKGYEYARTQNPTRAAWERCVAALERGEHGIAFSSGLAAIGAVMHLLRAGDHVIAADNLYGGTYRLFTRVFEDFGLSFSFEDTSDPGRIAAAARPETKLVFVETPTNPLMAVTDLREVSGLCRARGWRLVVDNTFLTPFFQRPLNLGADVVVHSSTKYLNGHCDVVGGIVVTSDPAAAERLRFVQNAVGAVPGPMDCWLALRGIKTLAVRMPRHESNAKAVVEFLAAHPRVRRVYYPGRKEHPGYEVSLRQTSGFGGMVSFDLADLREAKTVSGRTRLFALAESLGGVESLLCHPATMTHASVPREVRERKGLTDGLLRLSVGLEDPEDLIKDLEQALAF